MINFRLFSGEQIRAAPSGTVIKSMMVQETPSAVPRGVKRPLNTQGAAPLPPARSDGAANSLFMFGSACETNKRQKWHTETVQQEEQQQPPQQDENQPPKTQSTNPPPPCIPLENIKPHLECPVCLNVPKVGPIYQCRNGHLLCKNCHPKMVKCPICQIPLEKLRNLLSEQIVAMIYPEYQFAAERTPTRTRDFIWQGQLHWRENIRQSGAMNIPQLANQQQRIERNICLSISAAIENGVPEVVPVNWPSSLIMQTIPISLINRTGKDFFSNSRTVLFHPSEEESLKNLTNLLGNNGLAGCVHFSGTQNCEIKVLILLYSAERKVFLGFIPNDQTNFVERIREEIRKEKSKRDQSLGAIANTQFTNQIITSQQQQQQQPQHHSILSSQ